MEFFNFSSEMIISYIIFGYIINFVSTILTGLVASIKLISLDEKSKIEYTNFILMRTSAIKQNNTDKKLLISALTLWFIPTYTAWLNSVYLYHLFKYPGQYGLVKGVIVSDNLAIIKVVDYELH